MHTILTKINNVFTTTINDIYKETNIRNRKLSILDTILYRFKYSQINSTKQNIVSSINYDNNKIINRTSYDRKDNNIPLKYYRYIFTSIKNIYNNTFKNNNEKNIIAIDGTYINTNINRNKGTLQTSLCMGYYDINNNIPIDFTFNGEKDKNNEIKALKKWINDNKIKNITIVADRAYFSYELYTFLEENNIKYIIRIKENAEIKTNIKKTNKQKLLIENLKKINRIIDGK